MAGIVARAIAALVVEGPVCRRGGWCGDEMGCVRRPGARGAMSTGGASEGLVVFAADEAVIGPDVLLLLAWECSRQKDSYVRPELADGGDCVAE